MSIAGCRALVDGPNWLGDFCHTVPAIETLLAARANVELLVPAAHLPLARLLAVARERPRGAGWLWARRSLAARYAAALSARHATRAKLLLRGVRADRRLASAGRGCRPLGLDAFPVDRALHQRHDLDGALTRLDVAPASSEPARLPLSRELRSGGEEALASLGLRSAVALLPSSHADALKRWPLERYAALAAALAAADRDCAVLVGPGEESIAGTLVAAGARTVPASWPLDRIAAVLACCAAAVGNDSGLTHLAALAGCPTIALFGPTDPSRTAPVGGATILRAPRLEDLSEEAVVSALHRFAPLPQ